MQIYRENEKKKRSSRQTFYLLFAAADVCERRKPRHRAIQLLIDRYARQSARTIGAHFDYGGAAETVY